MAVTAIPVGDKDGRLEVNRGILRIPIVNAALVDAEADVEVSIDVGPNGTLVSNSGKVEFIAPLLARAWRSKLVVEADTLTGTPDITIDSLSISNDDSQFRVLEDNLNQQVNAAESFDIPLTTFPGLIRSFKVLITVASLDGSNKFGKFLLYWEVALADHHV